MILGRSGSSDNSLQENRESRWSDKALLALLILFAVVPYSNALINGFVYDDTTQILDNPYIQSFHYVGRILTTPAWSYIGKLGLTNYYRPVMTLGYLLCFKVFGANPYGFHLVSVLLHALVVLLLFGLTRKLFHSRGAAFLAAALFALHPIHTESVDWVAAVTDLEVTLFLLAAFWFFVTGARAEGKFSLGAFAGMAAAFILALGSKEQALMFPLLVTAYEHFYREDRHRTNWRQKISRYFVFWVITLAYVLFRFHIFGAFAPIVGHPELSQWSSSLSGLALVAQYVWKLFWPAQLSAFHLFSPSTSLSELPVVAGLVTLAACAVLFVFLWKRARTASFGMIWFFATLAPVLNARMLAGDSIFAERYLYLPSIGFCWMVGCGLARLWDALAQQNKNWRTAMAGGLGLIAVLYSARIITRNPVWRDEFTLDTVTLEAAPGAVALYNNLGSVYWARGDVDNAARVWEKALELTPRSATLMNNLGLVALKRGQLSGAIELFKKAIAVEPQFPDVHLNLGMAYEDAGKKDQAEVQYQAAISLAPLNLHAHNRLGNLYVSEHRDSEAEKQFAVSASIAPNVVAFDALGRLLMQRKDTARAEGMFRLSLGLNPDNPGARMALAEMFVGDGRIPEAFEQYRAILKFDPQNAAAREALDKLSKTHEPPH